MRTFAHTRRSTVASTTAQHLTRLSDTLEAIGLNVPKAITEANAEALAGLDRLKQYRADANPEGFAREVEAKMSAGTASIADIMAAASAREVTTSNPFSALSRMFTNAEQHISKTLHKAYADHGNKWVTETLRPTVDKHVATIIKAAPELLTVDPRREPKQLDTLLYIPAVMEAWGALETIYRMFHQLRSLSIIPSSFQPDDCYEFNGEPSAREAMRGSLTWFVWAAHNRQAPGIYTEAEVEHNWK